jgi:ATP-dependent helicase/nuclease subunit A
LRANSPTAQQQQAISARGNVLVVAGAGAGKTQTVVDRCLAWLLDEKNEASIDQILMVTFTQAAAAEMRHRLRLGLERAQAQLAEEGRASLRLAEQLALLDTAHISTLHSFCFQLVSRHFYELGLDPQSRILPEERARLLERQALGGVLDSIYASDSAPSLAIQRLIQAQGGDWDAPVRELILRLHHYTQTLRDPAAWFAEQKALFETEEPHLWREWLMQELHEWRNTWLPILRAQPAVNKNAAQCAAALAKLSDNSSRAEYAEALETIASADENWPKPRGPLREPIKKIFDDAEFLRSVCAVGESDPLAEDWNWARSSMLALLDLEGQFARAYQEAKRREGGLDYHDLEQFALRLLWKDGRPGEIAQQWRRAFHLIFVDEYQDINEAQESIIKAVAREGPEANRFLVGDVKQSIYGFRLADPRIFTRYHTAWNSEDHARVIPLTENFRSHEAILDCVNSIFAGLMRADTGGVDYDENARLQFGAAEHRAHLAAGALPSPPVELHLRCKGREDESGEASESESDAELEARMVALRLRELKNQHAMIFDRAGQAREVDWSDMVVLLRSPRNKVEAYVKEFAALEIPLAAARGGFYESLEVTDLLNILKLLDNPLQDLPLLGVLRSPLAGLAASELAVIRLADPDDKFWHALVKWQKTANKEGGTYRKVSEFLEGFAVWRKLARQSAVSQCLEQIIDGTKYGERVAAQERGAQKRANVERFLQLTRQFDAYDGESLYRFLKFTEAQQENEVEIEPGAVSAANAVRLMSIHQSKGLEFPVVAVADLGKAFNLSDIHSRIILDEEYGLCPQIQPPETPQFYPSLPHWLAQRRQKQKMLGEEMRLLYVALTRAGQRLILAGTTTQKTLDEKWPERTGAQTAMSVLSARNFLDWVGPWFAGEANMNPLPAAGQCALLTWTLYDENDARLVKPPPLPAVSAIVPAASGEFPVTAWQYPFLAETTHHAKTSVTTIRRQISNADGQEAAPMFGRRFQRVENAAKKGLSATEIGLAHHVFLQWAALEKLDSAAALKSEADRLRREKVLTQEQAESLDFPALLAFWQSEPGRQLRAQSALLQRELEFTARFSMAELQELGCQEYAGTTPGEFVVVQGVMDLVVILAKEIWLLDFKTDQARLSGLEEKIREYRPQMMLYSMALERTYRRPVTKRWLHFLALRETVAL